MVLDIFDTLFARAQGPRPVQWYWGVSLRDATAQRHKGMRHVWNEQYGVLYDRTYRVLYDAGVNEKLADELATQRTLAVALRSREHRPVAVVDAFEPSNR